MSPIVLITGALTGIGRATAVAFAKEGASIVASGRREAEGKAPEAELRSLGTEAAFSRADGRHDARCGIWSTRLLHASAALTPPSTPHGGCRRIYALVRYWRMETRSVAT